MENLILVVPPDQRGDYVLKTAAYAGVEHFDRDEYGNIKFEASQNQFDKMKDISCIGTYKYDYYTENGKEQATGLCMGDISYGSVWFSQAEYDDYQKKMEGAY